MENNELRFEFSDRLKFIAWIEYKGIRAVNTAYAGGDVELLIHKVGSDGSIISYTNTSIND